MSQNAKENAGLEPMAEMVLRFYLMHAYVVGWYIYMLIACIPYTFSHFPSNLSKYSIFTPLDEITKIRR